MPEKERFKLGDVRSRSKVVILDAGNAICTLKRTKVDKHRPGTWDLPGGEALENESHIDCAIRETSEETGLWLPRSLFQILLEDRRLSTKGPHVNDSVVYLVQLGMFRPQLSPDPKEVQAVDWQCPENAYRNLSHPMQRQAIGRFLETVDAVRFEPGINYA